MDPEQPVTEDVEAWAERERKRREAWLAGPTAEERAEWARRYRRRAAIGLAESRLGPTKGEVDAWAERETKRRQAWLAGPTEDEKQEWARAQKRRGMIGLAESTLPPTQEEVEAWAERERTRRREWLAGPTDDEKQSRERRPSASFADVMAGAAGDTELFDLAHRVLREAELAGKGSLYTLAQAPMAVWARLVRAGSTLEEELSQPPRKKRVPY